MTRPKSAIQEHKDPESILALILINAKGAQCNSCPSIITITRPYRMAGNFRGVQIFVFFVVDLAIMKIPTHEINASDIEQELRACIDYIIICTAPCPWTGLLS
jgi:hypothetical protein